jgi:hypothetical protein
VIAHVGGLPVEETIVQLAPAGIGALLLVRIVSERIGRLVSWLAKPLTRVESDGAN